jgi:hypothetical protein
LAAGRYNWACISEGDKGKRATEPGGNVQTYRYSGNYDDPLLAELYDQSETYVDDVELIRRLIGESGTLSILEPFSGTGRILTGLARDGHSVTGIEVAPSMNARAVDKVARLGADVLDRVTLKVQDVLDGEWGSGYDLVIIGANAFYELPAAEMQERCIRFARESLVPGGRLFVDNDDYKGDWGKGPFGEERAVFEGVGTDGTFGRTTMASLRFDKEQGVLHMKRTWFTRAPDGTEQMVEYLGRKHPVSAKEVEGWLRKHGFEILRVFGDRQGNQHTAESGRAIFWARKPG